MSNVARVAGQAANTLVKPLNVEEVFSTYLYTGDGTTSKQITNDIDLSTEGGLVWIKRRSDSSDHRLMDTERGASSYLASNLTDASSTGALSSFNTDGFTIGNASAPINVNSSTYASWTWRKAPKFFDVVTYTGDGVDNRTIAHNLGSVPGMIIVKSTSSADQWPVYHRSLGTGALRLNLTNAYNSADIWWKTTPTDSVFTVYGGGEVNVSGVDYVAYLFAHNDGDGGFGPNGDADIIKCGSYTGDGTTNGTNEVTLGFEPEWILTKRSDSADNWHICDVMRGQTTDGSTQRLRANTNAAESSNFGAVPTATGFKLYSDNSSGGTYIYIAIRRGPMGIPESGTDVFTPVLATSSGTFTAEAGFPVDLNWYGRRSVNDGGFTWDRLRGANYLMTNSTGSEIAYSAASFDSNTAFYLDGLTGDYSDFMTYNWRRAPNYFDVVAYTGNGTAGLTVSHNLGVAPEMMWVKGRNNAFDWTVYHKDAAASGTVAESSALELNKTLAVAAAGYVFWDNTAPTSSVITLGDNAQVNQSGYNYIAYLFASLAGVSKVGSYTGNGTSQTIDCGFSSGARFILIKRTDSTGDWYIWDTERGIVAGNDPYLRLNVNAAEVTSTDFVDPDSSGFAVNGTTINASGGTYIFYAIA